MFFFFFQIKCTCERIASRVTVPVRIIECLQSLIQFFYKMFRLGIFRPNLITYNLVATELSMFNDHKRA